MPAIDNTRTQWENQAAAAARRYRDTGDERRLAEEQLAAGKRFPDSREAVAARARRLLDRAGVPAAAAVAKIHADALDLPVTNERIIGISNELQPWSFLPRGARAAATVTRISLRRAGRELPQGTGFLVSPRLLMTNHHVLPDPATAHSCFVEFNAQVTIDNTPDAGVRMELDPDTLFLADEHLDFALVHVRPAGSRAPGEIFGWNELSAQLGTVVVGEPVNVIGHPGGRLKEIAVRSNALLVRLDAFLQYAADTEPGNSGSPVFNDQWEVVALHHLGVPRTDDRGRVLRHDGRPWQRSDGDDAVDYVANEGIRISAVLAHLAALPLDSRRRSLLAEMGTESGLAYGPGHPVTPLPGGPLEGGTPRPGPDASGEFGESLHRTGLRARPGAFGGTRSLAFLHGRSQQGKDPEALRRDWTGGLNQGLTRAGATPLAPADIWFPYYGDLLATATGHPADEALDAVPAPPLTPSASSPAELLAPPGPAEEIYRQLIAETARATGLPPDDRPATEGLTETLVARLRRQLGWLAARTDLDEWVIAATLSDVAAYLGDRQIRGRVLDCVLETLPATGALVWVTHSLGTVVAMDLVSRLPAGLRPLTLVTVGSPLGLDAVHRRLLRPGTERPASVTDWINVWCPTDAVAVGCPLAPVWGEVTDIAVINARDRAHRIDAYLSHPEVAARLAQALDV
ncbi:trypsin-like peptidase domain-containing protein [Streptomyces sp. NPDC048644]|uniref:trypsin-like peptidase domain-containing protein n=1 Tax=Streptomyces sp. NPDC048644 TaxID=3365582 RepID=UPI00371F8CC9